MRKPYAVGIDPRTTEFKFWRQNTAIAFLDNAQAAFGLSENAVSMLWQWDNGSRTWVPIG